MLISVMRDNMSCEEVFELDTDAQAMDEWEREAMITRDAEEVCWCKFFESCPSCFGKK